MSVFKCPGQDPLFLKAEDIAEAKCPACGRAIEFWPDELMRKCPGCGRRLSNPENCMKCLEWCQYAAQCLAAIWGEDAERLRPLRTELIERMEKGFGDDQGRIEHALAVLSLSEEIGQQVGANPLVLVPAAILHDMGRASSQDGAAGMDHGQRSRQMAAEMLTDLRLPRAVEQEILDLVEYYHDREIMNTPNGAPIFDADLIVNLKEEGSPGRRAILGREALTEAGKRIGAVCL